MFDISQLKFGERGLIPAVTQDFLSGEVLMLAYMNGESLKKTLETGRMHYFSRSRNKLWQKGESSGNYQIVISARYDCDADALLFLVDQQGVACHTGNKSCFYRTAYETEEAKHLPQWQENIGGSGDTAPPAPAFSFETLSGIIKDRRDNPAEGSYTNYLFNKGLDKILKKVGEETSEVIIAAKNKDKTELIYEAADLIYHLSVLFAEAGVEWTDITNELSRRHK